MGIKHRVVIGFRFNPRLEDSHYVKGSFWEFSTVTPPDQRCEYYDELDGRAAWFMKR